MHTTNDNKRRCCITLLYLPAKIIFASGNFKHALYTAACNLHAQLQHDQTRCCCKKVPIYVARLRGPEMANIRSRMLCNASSIISKADQFTRMLHYRDRFVPHRRNCEHVVPTVRATDLKRLSAILHLCFEERCQTRSFSPESLRQNHVDRENAKRKSFVRWNDERKPRI